MPKPEVRLVVVLVTLTPRQQQVLDFIRAHTTDRGYPPTVREIADEVGLFSTSTVAHHLTMLEKAGVIRRGGGRARAIAVVEAAPN